jgi:hypothetical protein
MVAEKLIVLGPQRLQPTVRTALESIDAHGGRIAVITAGWEEREQEDGELVDHLGGNAVNLRLHQRAEDVFQRDPQLFEAMQARFDRRQRLRDLYRLRLDHALAAVRELRSMEGDDDLLEEERRTAVEAVRRLDSHHLSRTNELQRAFDEEHNPPEREAVVHHRREIDAILADCSALCIAGGHVGILLNRLRMFGIEPWARKLPVACWSAGAMALSERVVLFHDSPPQGRVNAEVFEEGLGILPRIVPLPHARRRLLLDDPLRVGLLALRFGPGLCAALDDGSRLDRQDDAWLGHEGTQRLCADGTLAEVGRWS